MIDLPVDIPEKPDALALKNVNGEIAFEDVTFQYETGDENLLSDVHRYGSMDNVTAVLSGARTVVRKKRSVPHPGAQHCSGPGKFSRFTRTACGTGGQAGQVKRPSPISSRVCMTRTPEPSASMGTTCVM